MEAQSDRHKEANYIFACALLDELVTEDYSEKNYNRHKDNYLEGKITLESWNRYWGEHKKKKKEKNPFAIFGVIGQVENFYENRPFFYNKSGMFFNWENDEKKYDVCDDVDMLNGVSDLGMDTITSKAKQEIINGLKQFGRRKIPEEPPVTWIQFKNKIIDSKSGDEFDSSPDYFMTNPLPYSPSDCDETPHIDKLFEEWVGKDYIKTLYEIIAYSCCSEQFMQRMFALVGGGSNGKGTFIKLLNKFIGKSNSCTSELKELCSNGFETSIIYKKLLCVLGEVSHSDMKNSNQIKKLAGEDDIRYCFKGKTPFSDTSITTLISLTNSLPKTPDKTMGFYRKWLIVDFPNQFEGVNCDILGDIPEEEFENLSRKCLNILNNLYKTKKFHNEGSFQDRMDRYEERSNPIGKFIEDYCDEELGGQYILNEFAKDFNNFAKKNHLQIQTVRQIGKILRDEGMDISSRNIFLDDKTKVSNKVILNIMKKTTRTTRTTEDTKRFTSKVSLDIHGSSGSSGSFEELKKEYEEDGEL